MMIFHILLCHLSLTLGFAPPITTYHHRFKSSSASVSAAHERRPAAPFFLEDLDDQQQQRSNNYNTQQQQQQQMDEYQRQRDYYYQQQQAPPSQPQAGPATTTDEYQRQRDYYNQQSSQAATQASQAATQTTAPEQQVSSSSSSSTVPNSSFQDDGISNLDARVLESILAEGKLDLNSEEEVKKLLEGPRRTEEDFSTTANNNYQDSGKESGKYSSKVISVSSLIFDIYIHPCSAFDIDVHVIDNHHHIIFSCVFSPFHTTLFFIIYIVRLGQ
jgi:hypothetical protein